MEVRELRIGNLVKAVHKKSDILNSYIVIEGKHICDLENGKSEFDFYGIPITEEWLLKFGKIEWISKDVGGIFYWFNGEKKYLKFVHLLQNTYFCIEQKELLCVNI